MISAPVVYIGNFCHDLEDSSKEFFAWYFRNSLKYPAIYPQNRTRDEWLAAYFNFCSNELLKIRKQKAQE